MGLRKYANNVTTKLTAQLLVGGTTVNVTGGDGALFAAATGGDYIIATLRRMSGFRVVASEIVMITARATDALTITRAQEGTTALQFEVGDRLDVDFTKESLGADLLPQAIPRVAAGGTVNAITATVVPTVTLADQVMVAVVSAGANTTTTPTFAPNGLTARTIVARGGLPLVAGDIGPAGHVAMLEYNLANTRWELLNPAGVARGGGLATVHGFPPAMQNLLYVPGVGSNLATGNTDLYTVPTNRKALVSPYARGYNGSAGTITFYTQIKVSGVYYRISADSSPTTGTGQQHDFGVAIILNAGESLAINCATNTGLNIRYNIFEFDAADDRLQGARILALASGNNTLLTVAAGKTAVGVGGINALLGSAVPQIGQVRIVNTTGGSLDYYGHVVPSGGSVGSTNRYYPTTAVAAAASTGMLILPTMTAGDFVNINASGAGGIAWATYYQIP